MNRISIVECPRDAWQGIHEFIPTAEKVAYLKRLLQCGFDTLDAGSFVSPRAMPQMADAYELFGALEEAKSKSPTKLLAICREYVTAIRIKAAVAEAANNTVSVTIVVV